MSASVNLSDSCDGNADIQLLEDELRSKILKGQQLLSNDFSKIKGSQKLIKRISQEVNFLKKVLEQQCVKKEHVKCTNLSHLEALVNCLLDHQDKCSSVLETFELRSVDAESKRVCVDIVSDRGRTWIKVIARNPKALSILSSGDGEYGQRTVTDQAREFIACAEQHPFHFKIPKVMFVFASGIEVPLASVLGKMGVEVIGQRINTSDYGNGDISDDSGSFESKTDSDDDLEEAGFGLRLPGSHDFQTFSCTNSQNEFNECEDRLNLDVTAMIAYVSSLSNGGCELIFKEPLLTQQAEWERKKPAKPILDNLFKGRKLFCCETAQKDFLSIMKTLGGSAERSRAEDLLKRVTVVPDQMSDRTRLYLSEGGKVKQRSKIIFGTGDRIRAVTVTANEGFVRAAKSRGLTYAVFVHESRALTESKEVNAKPL